MSIAFSRFDCLAADLATARHNWNEHKLKLVLTNGVPDKAADKIAGLHMVSLTHRMERSGRTVAVSVDPVIVRAAGATIGPFTAVSIINSTTGAPIVCADLGKAVTLEDGSSTEFRFPADIVYLVS